jgi:hypothetical protein
MEKSRLKWAQAEIEISHMITPQNGRLKKFHIKPPFGCQIGELRSRLKHLAEHIANSAHIFSTTELDRNKESEELFVESDEMKIYSQTGPTFSEFDARHHPNIVNGHYFLTLIFCQYL